MKSCLLLWSVLLCTSQALAQGGRPIPPGVRQAAQAQDKFEKSIPPTNPKLTINLTKIRQDADELAVLAQSIPGQVDQTTKGVLPKDLDEKLKRIEKLAKHLRSQISQ